MPLLAKTAVCSALILGSLSLASAESATGCNEADTQADMASCASEAYGKADGELNEIYNEILSRLIDDTAIESSLKTAQRSWVEFRDAECAFVNSRSGGSLASTLVSLCLTKETEKRSETLRGYLNCEEGDMSCPVPRD